MNSCLIFGYFVLTFLWIFLYVGNIIMIKYTNNKRYIPIHLGLALFSALMIFYNLEKILKW